MKRRTENGKRRTENGKLSTFHFTSLRSVWAYAVPLSTLFFVLLLFASCTAKKKLTSHMAHVADYEWIMAKTNGELKTENGELIRFTGNLRMRRDSTVWISVSAFMGMESLRTLVTQDSVIVVNRMNQTYLAEPNPLVIETVCTPSLQEIQALLLGDGTSDHVEIKWGPYIAKIQYSDIHWDEPTTFPIKINKNYQRIKP